NVRPRRRELEAVLGAGDAADAGDGQPGGGATVEDRVQGDGLYGRPGQATPPAAPPSAAASATAETSATLGESLASSGRSVSARQRSSSARVSEGSVPI